MRQECKLRGKWRVQVETCKPVEVLKTETTVPVQTRRRLASVEKAGGAET